MRSPIWVRRTLFRSKVDGFVPRTRHVNLRIVYQPEWTGFVVHDEDLDGSVYRLKLTSIPTLTSVRCASLPASVSYRVVQLVVQSYRWLYTGTVAESAVHLVVPVPRKVDIRLPGKGNSNFFVARLVH